MGTHSPHTHEVEVWEDGKQRTYLRYGWREHYSSDGGNSTYHKRLFFPHSSNVQKRIEKKLKKLIMRHDFDHQVALSATQRLQEGLKLVQSRLVQIEPGDLDEWGSELLKKDVLEDSS